jgi:hypothetical protein
MFLKEALLATTGWTAYKRQKAIFNLRQHPFCDLLVVLSKIQFREAILRIKDLVRMGQCYPGDFMAAGVCLNSLAVSRDRNVPIGALTLCHPDRLPSRHNSLWRYRIVSNHVSGYFIFSEPLK